MAKRSFLPFFFGLGFVIVPAAYANECGSFDPTTKKALKKALAALPNELSETSSKAFLEEKLAKLEVRFNRTGDPGLSLEMREAIRETPKLRQVLAEPLFSSEEDARYAELGKRCTGARTYLFPALIGVATLAGTGGSFCQFRAMRSASKAKPPLPPSPPSSPRPPPPAPAPKEAEVAKEVPLAEPSRDPVAEPVVARAPTPKAPVAEPVVVAPVAEPVVKPGVAREASSQPAREKKIDEPVTERAVPEPTESHDPLTRSRVGLVETPTVLGRIEAQKFGRTPQAIVADGFERGSVKSNRLFNNWLNRKGEAAQLSFQKMLESMHTLYRKEMGLVGGEAEYRGEVVSNGRAELTRNYIRKYGLEPYQNSYDAKGHISMELPGIPADFEPGFVGPTYYYSPISAKEIYYEALNTKLKEFAMLAKKIQDGRSKDKLFHLKKENKVLVDSALDAVVDFGRIAAAFRPFHEGNWGLFGPMISSMVARTGFSLKHPGYLDILFQGAKPKTLKPYFRDAVRGGKEFFLEEDYLSPPVPQKRRKSA